MLNLSNIGTKTTRVKIQMRALSNRERGTSNDNSDILPILDRTKKPIKQLNKTPSEMTKKLSQPKSKPNSRNTSCMDISTSTS